MKIKKIISQHRRDFEAIMVCEHCGNEHKLTSGYDDEYYHKEVVPNMKCEICGKTSPEDYTPQATKYGAHEVI
jgi:transcription elongation factor Elf1